MRIPTSEECKDAACMREQHVKAQLRKLGKTPLPLGAVLEEAMAAVALRTEAESPVHSFIFDLEEMEELCARDPAALPSEDLDYVRTLWNNRPSKKYFRRDPADKYERFTTRGLRMCADFMSRLETMVSQGSTFAQLLGAVAGEAAEDEEPFLELYGVIFNFCMEWRSQRVWKDGADHMRQWDKLFDALAPKNIRFAEPCSSPPSMPPLSSIMKRWQTPDGDTLVCMVAKKTTWVDDPDEAEQAILRATKASKDAMDQILRRLRRTVETWVSVTLGRHWTLRCSYRLASGVIVTGNVGTWLLPNCFSSFPRLLGICRIVLLWGLALEDVAREIRCDWIGSPPRGPLRIAETFSPPKPEPMSEEEASPSRKRSRR
ncbi:uncharacterized protein SPPG_06430 [Spizellomyces punctatus DAOM BR117]|uniref:Uncharacterized protein n=1 Tax=Spizellomyces punctatus (strain DAOM BR117) TaxID=645134 RepID=A0A0L0H8Z8_SPIPD|nr:uncharacterized protein SPPG_06430 [Spizellomyces punctatus DAOM BR117]KNC98010.1 hypothetical protein SPPG_06430 [Spizellomyces punctatus DAOM BR117]|eukprot:XP_016606050.1 hypothetical protein SPPG_06430 [Spizellomyces punctatus DAOM BR117]